MDRVIFLDRDGTINEEVEYLHRPEDLRFLPGVGDAIRRLRENGFAVVVVTNQAGVARGYYKEEDVILLHEYMNERLKEQGAFIDHFFYCIITRFTELENIRLHVNAASRRPECFSWRSSIIRWIRHTPIWSAISC